MAARHTAEPNPARTKAILWLLIAEISVTNRDQIQPIYRLATTNEEPVRPTTRKVGDF